LLLEGNASLSPIAVREVLRQMASLNYISDLSPADDNLLLYVDADGEEPLPKRTDPWPTDDFFAACKAKDQVGPRPEGVCMCRRRMDRVENGTMCYKGEKTEPGCPVSDSLKGRYARDNGTDLTLYYFLVTCTDCNCHESPPGPEVPETRPQRPLTHSILLGIFGMVAAVTICASMHFLGQKRNSAEAQQELAKLQVP